MQVTPSRQLTDTEKLRKVITELIETERTYVKVILSPDLDLDLSLTILSASKHIYPQGLYWDL